jgi:hypothetical protein
MYTVTETPFLEIKENIKNGRCKKGADITQNKLDVLKYSICMIIRVTERSEITLLEAGCAKIYVWQ